ncbi:LysR family transcriptional regulator, partial [Enterocloster asparagiformis]
MQLRDIHYVLAAADEGSFSKAAVKVHVSQPALSQLIQQLEDELGV